VVAANIVAPLLHPPFGMLAHRVGRKPVHVYGVLSAAVVMPF
jgi:MFS family permease